MKRPADGGACIKSFERSEKDFMKAFECKRCGACCHGEGGILADKNDIEHIAAFLGTTPEFFLKWYCETRNGKIYLRSRGDGYCVFFDKARLCLIHPVKPGPCRLWPFYPALLKNEENWEMAKDACPGINPEASFEEFVRQGEKNTGKE
jgi:Fe-S-cluster containining protein